MKLILSFILILPACGPRCLKGHDIVQHYEGYTYTDYHPLTIGETTIYIPYQAYQPPYDRMTFICDQYELEKPIQK